MRAAGIRNPRVVVVRNLAKSEHRNFAPSRLPAGASLAFPSFWSAPIELQAWRNPESCTFATPIYDKAGERLLQQFTGPDENEVLCQALMWCEKN
jgi:hypothetical protein